MNSKGHLRCSLIKSLLRMIGCMVAIINPSLGTLKALGWLLLVAEGLGILEELLDLR